MEKENKLTELKSVTKQQQETGFTIKGKIDFVIKMEGNDTLHIDFKNSEEAILINLFGAMNYMRNLDEHARSKQGKPLFSQEERRSIGITKFSLEKATEHFGKTVYAKMMETLLTQNKKNESANQQASNEQGEV